MNGLLPPPGDPPLPRAMPDDHAALAIMAEALRGSALAGLDLTASDDPAVALLSSWALACEVLSFYQARIAAEGYLASATQAESIGWLARIGGTRRLPGSTAHTLLAVTLAEGTRQAATLALGAPGMISVHNVPAAGELPVVFESEAAGVLSARWNAIALAANTASTAPMLAAGARSMAFSARTVQIRAGDALLVELAPAASGSASQTYVLLPLVAVETDSLAGVTLAIWQTPFPGANDGSHLPIQCVKLVRPLAGLFGRTAQSWSSLGQDLRDKLGACPGGLVTLDPPSSDERLWHRPGSNAPGGTMSCLLCLTEGSLIVASGKDLWLGTPDGEWRAAVLPPGRFDVRALTEAPDGTVLAGTASGRLLRSDDGGATWFEATAAAKPSSALPINALVAIVPRGQMPARWRLFAGTDRAVQVFDPENGTWSPFAPWAIFEHLGAGLPAAPVRALTGFGGRLVAGTAAGLFSSCPSRPWWRRAAKARDGVSALCVDNTGKTLFVATNQGIEATPDLAIWHPFSAGLPDADRVHALASAGPDLIAAVPGGLFTSPARHSRWQANCEQALRLFAADPALAGGLASGEPSPDLVGRLARAGILNAADAAFTPVPPPAGATAAWHLTDGEGRRFRLVQGRELIIEQIVPLPSFSAFGYHRGRVYAAATKLPAVDREWPGFAIDGSAIVLDRTTDAVAAHAQVLLMPEGQALTLNPVLHKVTGVSTGLHRAFGKSASVTRLQLDNSRGLCGFDLRQTRAMLVDAPVVPLVHGAPELPVFGADFLLASRGTGLARGQQLLVTGRRRAAVILPAGKTPAASSSRQLLGLTASAIAPELDHGLIGRRARPALASGGITLSRDAVALVLRPGAAWLIRDRDSVWWITARDEALWQAELELLELTSPWSDDLRALRFADVEGSEIALAEGEVAVWQGPARWQSAVTQLAEVATVRQGAGGDVITLALPIAVPFDRVDCRICANVVPASHGETIPVETLGEGAAQGRTAFQLLRHPLAWRDANAGQASRPDLAVHVDAPEEAARRHDMAALCKGALWQATDDLSAAGPQDRVFELRTDADGRTVLMFGDGNNGAALPPGRSNVTASYRAGGGLAGNVTANSLRVLRRRPAAIKQVTNPLPVVGGRLPEDDEAMRQRAMRGHCRGQRIVSLADYAAFARDFPGVLNARADLLQCGAIAPRVALSVQWNSAEADSTAARKALTDAIRRIRADCLDLVIGDVRECGFSLRVAVVPTAAAHREQLPGLVYRTLDIAMRRGMLPIGSFPDATGIAKLVRQVAGVADARIEALGRGSEAACATGELVLEPARLGDDGALIGCEAASLIAWHTDCVRVS